MVLRKVARKGSSLDADGKQHMKSVEASVGITRVSCQDEIGSHPGTTMMPSVAQAWILRLIATESQVATLSASALLSAPPASRVLASAHTKPT